MIGVLIIIGACMLITGLYNLYKPRELYSDDNGRTGDLKAWKSYAKSLGTRPMARELDLMSRDEFIKELAICYNIFIKEV